MLTITDERRSRFRRQQLVCLLHFRCQLVDQIDAGVPVQPCSINDCPIPQGVKYTPVAPIPCSGTDFSQHDPLAQHLSPFGSYRSDRRPRTIRPDHPNGAGQRKSPRTNPRSSGANKQLEAFRPHRVLRTDDRFNRALLTRPWRLGSTAHSLPSFTTIVEITTDRYLDQRQIGANAVRT